MEKEAKDMETTKEIYEKEIDKELSKLNLDNIDIGEIDFDGVKMEDIDFEDLALEDFQNLDQEFENILIGKEKQQNKIAEAELPSGNIMSETKEDKIETNNLLTEETQNMETRQTEKSDIDNSVLLEESIDNISMEGLTGDAGTEVNSINQLLTGKTNETEEESFDMDSLLSEVPNGVGEESFDMDSLLSEATNGEEEEDFNMNSLLTEETLDDSEEEGLDNLDETAVSDETESFSFDNLFDGDLDFTSSSNENHDENISLEDQEITLDNLTDMLDSSVLDAMPDAEEMVATEEKMEKKKGLFARLFGNVKDEKWEKQKAQEEQREEEKRLKAEEKKKVEEEAEEGEKELTKAEKKAAKRAEKEAKKAEKKAAKAQVKKEKEEKKAQEKEAGVEEVIEDEGRINKVGASIVFVLFGAFAIAVVVGTNVFSYNQSIKSATNLFDVKKYSQAYNQIRGMKVKNKDEEIYNKIITVMYVDKQLNSYNNYYGIKLYPEALDSLLKGLDKYDKHLYEAKQLGIKGDFDYVKNEILTELGNTFEVSEQEAYDMIDMKDKEEYSEKVRKIANGEE